MTRFERRQFFDRLCELRDRYAARSADDSTSVMTIEAAMDYATGLLAVDPVPTSSSETATSDAA